MSPCTLPTKNSANNEEQPCVVFCWSLLTQILSFSHQLINSQSNEFPTSVAEQIPPCSLNTITCRGAQLLLRQTTDDDGGNEDDSGFDRKVPSVHKADGQPSSSGPPGVDDDRELAEFKSAVEAVQPLSHCTWDTLMTWKTKLEAMKTSRKIGKGRPSVTMVQQGKAAKKGDNGEIISDKIDPIVPHCPFPTSNRSVSFHIQSNVCSNHFA